TGETSGGTRTSIWTTAIDTGAPAGWGAGRSAGARTSNAAATASPARTAPLPRRSRAAARTALTNTTTKVTPQTPVIAASGRSQRSSTCEVPRADQVKPPSGHMPLIQSIAVQTAAIATALRIGRSGRSRRTAIAPKVAIDAADSATSAVHASVPNNAIQYSDAPNSPTP